jgi:hypothetical protein
MHEPLLERIRQLETSNHRWRLVCLALALALISLLAIMATVGTMLVVGGALDRNFAREVAEQRARAEEARAQEARARAQAEEAMLRAKQAEAQVQAPDP